MSFTIHATTFAQHSHNILLLSFLGSPKEGIATKVSEYKMDITEASLLLSHSLPTGSREGGVLGVGGIA